MKASSLLVGLLLAVGCGGGVNPSPVISSDLAGTFENNSFSVNYGFADRRDEESYVVLVGEGELGCGSLDSPVPPDSGYYILIEVPDPVVGIPPSHDLVYVEVDGDEATTFRGPEESLEITAVTPESIALTIDYFSDLGGDEVYGAFGSLEVERCD